MDQSKLQIRASNEPVVVDSSILDGIRVLVVEDSEDLQLLTSMLLKSRGANVDVAENGQVALEKVRVNKYDVVLMDIQMPVMDGYKATAQMRKEGYSFGIIALTARLMKEEIDAALAAGCDDTLSKPINQASLYEAVYRYGKKSP